jgi:hypothetical protein
MTTTKEIIEATIEADQREARIDRRIARQQIEAQIDELEHQKYILLRQIYERKLWVGDYASWDRYLSQRKCGIRLMEDEVE